MRRANLLLCFLTALVLGPTSGWGQATQKPAPEQTIFVGEQVTYSPGFALGDIAIADPAVADFRVLSGRRELLLLGKAEGQTTLTLWDQNRVKRNEVQIRVTTREAMKIERDLRELLRDYPSVRLAPLGGAHVITGEVSSEHDLEAIQGIAEVAGVKSVVRYVPPKPTRAGTGEKTAPAATIPAATDVARTDATKSPEAAGEGTVEYEIQILEASVAFSSGTYGEGVQPSGAVLLSRKVQGAFGSPIQVEIMDPVLVAKLSSNKGREPKGLRLRITPSIPDEQGAFLTRLELETNLPYESKTYDPTIWRRARWQIQTVSGEPLGIAGSDLLAVMPEERSSGSIWQTLQNSAGVAGAFGAPGTNYATAYYYNPTKKTQLLMLIRPRVIPRSAG